MYKHTTCTVLRYHRRHMSPPERRRQLHGWVTVEALAGWHQFAEEQGTNVTALMEAIGRHLAQHQSGTDLPPHWVAVVKDAQMVAGRRSSRVQRGRESASDGSQ